MMCCSSNIVSKLPVATGRRDKRTEGGWAPFRSAEQRFQLFKCGTNSRIGKQVNTPKEGWMIFSRLVRGGSLAALVLSSFLLLVATATSAHTTRAGVKKPNIVVIFGDDVGDWNISAYNQGMM